MGEVCHLNVLHVASGDLWAGAEVQLFTLAKALHTISGTTVSVVLLNYGRLERELHNAGIKVIVLDESKLNGLRILRQLIHIIQDQKPDVIHTHRLKENILGSIAAFMTGNTPSLRTVHGAPEHRLSWWKLPKRMLNALDRYCGWFLQQKIVAVSDDLASILENDFPADKICVVENGIDLTTIHKDNQFPAHKEDNRGVFKVGLAGRLVPIKRVDIFIQTALYLNKNYPDLHANFPIFGDGPMRNELEKLSQKSGTEKIVSFMGQCEDMLQELQQLDVLMITSDHEGLPMILLEAIALQIPIIAHAVGGIPQLLDYGNCGILVHKQDGAVYAKEIYQLSNNPEARSKIVKNALQRVTKNYSSSRNASSYYSAYTAITRAKAHG